MGYDAGNASQPPCFVVTHSQPESIRLVDRFTIVTDGLESAIEKARAAAGVVDVLSLHIAPLVLNGSSN